MDKNIIHNIDIKIVHLEHLETEEEVLDTVIKGASVYVKESEIKEAAQQVEQDFVASRQNTVPAEGGVTSTATTSTSNTTPSVSAGTTPSSTGATVSKGTSPSEAGQSVTSNTTMPVEGGKTSISVPSESKESGNTGVEILPPSTGTTSQVYAGTQTQQFTVPQSFQNSERTTPTLEKVKTYVDGKLRNSDDASKKAYWSMISQKLSDGISIEEILEKDRTGNYGNTFFSDWYDHKNASYGEAHQVDWKDARMKMIAAIENNLIGQSTRDTYWNTVLQRLKNNNEDLSLLFEEIPELFTILKDVLGLPELPGTLAIYTTNSVYTHICAEDMYPSSIGTEAIYGMLKKQNFLEEVIVYGIKDGLINIDPMLEVFPSTLSFLPKRKEVDSFYLLSAKHIVEFILTYSGRGDRTFKSGLKRVEGVPIIYPPYYSPLKLSYQGLEVKVHKGFLKNTFFKKGSVKQLLLSNIEPNEDSVLTLDPKKYTFEAKPKGDIFTTYAYEYTLAIYDTRGEVIIEICSEDAFAMENLLHNLNFKIPEAYKQELINTFIAGIGEDKGRNKIDTFYTSLPSFLYTDENGILLEGDDRKLSNDHLKTDLKELLRGWVNDTGSNEERAVMNIVRAMSYDELYETLKCDNLLYKIYDKLSGDEYNQFVAHITSIAKYRRKQKAVGTITFSNEYWMFRDYHVDSKNTWDGGTISFKSYWDSNKKAEEVISNLSPVFGLIDLLKGDDAIKLREIDNVHPLDLIELTTIYPEGVESPKMEVLAFELYNKVRKQQNWDYFDIATDIIGIVTIVGGTYSILAKGAAFGVRTLALGAGVAKELSSILIRNKALTTKLQKEHPEVFQIWRSLDTTGNVVYGMMALPALAKFIKSAPEVLKKLKDGGVTGLRYLSKAVNDARVTFLKRFVFIEYDIAGIIKKELLLKEALKNSKKNIENSKKILKENLKEGFIPEKTIKDLEGHQKLIDKSIKDVDNELMKVNKNVDELNEIKKESLGFSEISKKVSKELDKLENTKKELQKTSKDYHKSKKEVEKIRSQEKDIKKVQGIIDKRNKKIVDVENELSHATTKSGEKNIKKYGVDRSKGRANLDFNSKGQKAFYVHDNIKDTEKYMKRLSRRPDNFGIEIGNVKFKIPKEELSKLNIKVFEEASAEWVKFVTDARKRSLTHKYDIVAGPKLANPIKMVNEGELAKPLMTNGKIEFQIAFTTQKAVDLLNKYIIK